MLRVISTDEIVNTINIYPEETLSTIKKYCCDQMCRITHVKKHEDGNITISLSNKQLITILNLIDECLNTTRKKITNFIFDKLNTGEYPVKDCKLKDFILNYEDEECSCYGL